MFKVRVGISATLSQVFPSCMRIRATTGMRPVSLPTIGTGLDVLTVVFETPKEACFDYSVMAYMDQFTWRMRNVPSVQSVVSVSSLAKLSNSGLNEGNPKWAALPRDRASAGECDELRARRQQLIQCRLHGHAGEFVSHGS